ncbi:ABC transporter permease subunit [Streptomyces sp. NPDC002589]|uniref:ABC transporter permease subunit n=1 Tax=Streptomyces sp. NPDC002589 TaxID=3154420 RepID=UPI00331E5DD9
MEEAAAIDGAGPLRAYRHVILPVLRPATATLVITLTLAIWNDLVIPLVLLTCDSKQTMTLDATAHRRQYHRRGPARGEACPQRPGNATDGSAAARGEGYRQSVPARQARPGTGAGAAADSEVGVGACRRFHCTVDPG